MAVVPVDDRGRITLPKKVRRGSRATIISAGSFLVIIPLPEEPLEDAQSWIPSKRTRRALKKTAEMAARRDAVRRAKRHKQL